MTTETNEMDGSYLPAPTTDSIEVTLPTAMAAGDVDLTKDSDSDVTISNPTTAGINPESIYVYASTITPVTYDPGSAIVSFDVVFSVTHSDPSGTSSTHQVVKRIGVDKMKMVNDAKMSTPISIVEAKQPAPKEESAFTAARIKALAGIK